MPRVVLPGGTDVAEVALFSLDALPPKGANSDSVEAMERAGTLVRFPTGSDGGYLLHAYVDEPIPAEVARYCVEEDPLRSKLSLASGRIGFGGVESASESFKPNAHIRSDESITPGEYAVVAYRTEFPDELISAAVEARIGGRGQFLLGLPGYIIPIALLLTVGSYFMAGPVPAIFLIAITVIGLKFGYYSNPTIKRIQEQSDTASLEYPSIVIEMRSNWVIDADPRMKESASPERAVV